ncbi:MAG: T9SS type A sorting domain-containing protein [Candidatus Cloacimonetes bacterium]|nr:T9SS type A sorting domain-containing protein [Candidatus Cloacimonadota bacterium]
MWDGIFIQNPDDEANYWFVNCDISRIHKLSIKDVGATLRNSANLNMFYTNFYNSGQIIVEDEHILTFTGEGEGENHRGNIYNNWATPIVCYNSTVLVDNAIIEDNGYDSVGNLLSSSCDGIYIGYSANVDSKVINSLIQRNSGNGMKMYGSNIEIENNQILNNGRHGLDVAIGTFDYLQDNTIQNNVYTEYISVQGSYTWAGCANIISDNAVDQTVPYDQYILWAYKWDEVEHSIDVTGNPISDTTLERFYPYRRAFEFDPTSIRPPAKEMLISAIVEMKNDNFEEANSLFYQIISDYPETKEAATSLRGLFFIKNYTDKDYASLRYYIDNIDVGEETSLYKAKEDVKIKSFMKEEDYVTVINMLEEIIADPSSEEERIYAMIDEGYCYLKLEESGDRARPSSCTVKPKSFDDFRNTVQQLEDEFQLFMQPENQEQVAKTSLLTFTENYPNPFNPTTTISFSLLENSNVELSVFNVKGQRVTTLANRYFEEGSHSVIWNGIDNNKKSVSSGIYFYKISTDKETAMKKMLLLK